MALKNPLPKLYQYLPWQTFRYSSLLWFKINMLVLSGSNLLITGFSGLVITAAIQYNVLLNRALAFYEAQGVQNQGNLQELNYSAYERVETKMDSLMYTLGRVYLYIVPQVLVLFSVLALRVRNHWKTQDHEAMRSFIKLQKQVEKSTSLDETPLNLPPVTVKNAGALNKMPANWPSNSTVMRIFVVFNLVLAVILVHHKTNDWKAKLAADGLTGNELAEAAATRVTAEIGPIYYMLGMNHAKSLTIAGLTTLYTFMDTKARSIYSALVELSERTSPEGTIEVTHNCRRVTAT